MDSGSQVATVTDVFWRSHSELCRQELQRSDIPVEGAGGHAIPQYGVLYINLKVLNKEFTNVSALVVPVTEHRSEERHTRLLSRATQVPSCQTAL